LKEINEQYGANSNISHSFERGVETLVGPSGSGRIMLIGTSQMCRTAEFLPTDSVSLAILVKENIVEIEKKLQSLELGLTDTLILDLLSNVAYLYMRTDDDGPSTPAVTDRDKDKEKNRDKDKKGTWTRARTRTRTRTRTGTWNSQSFFKDPYKTVPNTASRTSEDDCKWY
jgi:hypothetical protein